ncbi:MAG: hypothetical protein H6834_12100 [Planctomycetes bacterium]|nr:hypothetical protein [Planctomycetota bacterium]
MTNRTLILFFLALLCLGAVLRGVEALGTSLWLDEYHTLWVADVDSYHGVVERIERDFHPPLFYYGLSFLRGVDPKLQRLVPILFSLLTLLPLLGLVRAAELSPIARLTTCGLFLLLPYQVHYAAELRAYSALQLAGCILAWAAFTRHRTARMRFAAFLLATALGLWMHYFVGVFLVLIGGVALLWRPAGTLSRKALLASGTLGCLAFLPWLLAVESWLLRDPGRLFRAEPAKTATAAPQADDSASDVADEVSEAKRKIRPAWWQRDTRKALQLPMQLLVPAIGTLEGSNAAGTQSTWRMHQLRLASYALFALAGLSIASFLARAIVRRGRVVAGPGWAVFLLGGVSLVAVTLLLMIVWKSVRLQYYAGIAWFLPFAIGLGVHVLPTRLANTLAGALLVCAAAAGVSYASGPSREDLDSGLRVAHALDPDGDAIFTAALWQPFWYPHAMPYDYPKFAGDVREPWDVPAAGDTDRPVILITRTITLDGARTLPQAMQTLVGDELVERPLHLRDGRTVTQHVRIDHAIHVYRFEKKR